MPRCMQRGECVLGPPTSGGSPKGTSVSGPNERGYAADPARSAVAERLEIVHGQVGEHLAVDSTPAVSAGHERL